MDRFRKKYVPLTQEAEFLIRSIKSRAEELGLLFNQVQHSREMSLALTNLEQSIMWATKAVAINDEHSQKYGVIQNMPTEIKEFVYEY